MSDARCFSVCLCMLLHVNRVVRVLSPYVYTIGAMLPTLHCGLCSWVVSKLRPGLFPVGKKIGLCSNSAFNGTTNRDLSARRLFSPRCVMQPGSSLPHANENSKEFLCVRGCASTLIKLAWSVQVLRHIDGDYNPPGILYVPVGLMYSGYLSGVNHGSCSLGLRCSRCCCTNYRSGARYCGYDWPELKP